MPVVEANARSRIIHSDSSYCWYFNFPELSNFIQVALVPLLFAFNLDGSKETIVLLAVGDGVAEDGTGNMLNNSK